MRIFNFCRRIILIWVNVCLSAGISGAVAYGCATSNQPPKVVKVAPIVWGGPSREIDIGAVTVGAMVTIDSRGNVITVQLPKGSGDKQLDQAVTEAARRSTYTPQIKDCKPIPGSLLVQFTWRSE